MCCRVAALPALGAYLVLYWGRFAPASCLFPYTTLFRSHGIDLGAEVEELEGAERLAAWPGVDLVPVDVREARDLRVGLQDRKSTRLNSSHGYTSYAVFCSKKKK